MPHGMLDPYSRGVKSCRKALYLWAIERRNICGAERLIYTTAEEQRLAAIDLSGLPKSVVVPLGGDAPAEHSEQLAAAFYERFPSARRRRLLLFLGRLHFKKGLDRILSAMPRIVAELPDVLLTIAGEGEPRYEAYLKRVIQTLGLQDSVMMTDRLEGATKWGAYAAAELFLLPSRQENFAISVAEAMHMGLPVVISNKVNSWPYVEAAGAGVVLDEERIERELEVEILGLLKDVGALKQMGRRGQEYAQVNLTWAAATNKMLNCYDEVLAARASLARGLKFSLGRGVAFP
jgi:glycosyltransferase involved in cell wall biosynthesis